jgi:hypothetical protein
MRRVRMNDWGEQTTLRLRSEKVNRFGGLPLGRRLGQGYTARDRQRCQLNGGLYLPDPGCWTFISEGRQQPRATRIPQLDQSDGH